MKKFSLDLYKNIQRPVIYLADWHKFDAMLDTGALFPVWVDEEKALIKLDAECIKEKVTFGGFGGEAIGNLYRLPYFTDLSRITGHLVQSQSSMSHDTQCFYVLEIEI